MSLVGIFLNVRKMHTRYPFYPSTLLPLLDDFFFFHRTFNDASNIIIIWQPTD
jgi:hypothetical protein